MTELGWVTVDGKRVLPVSAHFSRCSTSSEYWSDLAPPHVGCCLYSDCGEMSFCTPFMHQRGHPTTFINEDQLPAYLALRLEGLAP